MAKDMVGATSAASTRWREATEPGMELSEPGRVPDAAWGLVAMLCGVALSLVLQHQQHQRHAASQHGAWQALADRGFGALRDRLQSSERLVRSVQTVYLASDTITPTEFEHIYDNLRPRERFPSLLALAYVRRELHADGEHYITERVAPIQGNESVLGLDVNRQPGNYAAIQASRDSDTPAMSAPFHLVQSGAASGAADGVIVRLPVYSPGKPPRTLAERRARMRGSIGVSFRIGSLIETGLPGEVRRSLHVKVGDVTDGRVVPLFDSRPGWAPAPDAAPGHRFEYRLAFGGRVWQVAMVPLQPRPVILAWTESILPPGLLASLLLGLLVWSLLRTQRRALTLGRRMSRRYRESEERFRALNELLPALVLLADVEGGRVTYINQAARTYLGGHLCGQSLTSLFEDAGLRDPVGTGWVSAETVLRGEGGECFWASVSIARVRLDGRDQLVMVASDITEQRALTEQLSHQASHDELTELYNRREFERRLERVLAKADADGTAGALLYIDLDQFKLINDTSGHLAGDQLLAHLAIAMRKQLHGDDVLARLGGDEFGVLLDDVPGRGDAERIAERVRRCIDGYVFVWEQRSYTISASIGGVLIDRPGITVKDLLAQADTACYMAKELGRNRVHFYSEQDDETVRRQSEMEWANRLRWAVDEQRLVLVCQEIWPLPLAAGVDEVRVELLLRFRDESGELVVPGVFIPAAERYGLMPVIDRWVVQTTLANFDRLHPVGAGLRMAAINLSGASVDDGALADLIVGWLQRYRVEPSRVCFEITETVAVRNLSRVVRFMERLRAVGCRISLDDFGAGMSSFTYLKNLPVDIIKIDGSFIRDMLSDPVSHVMVRSVTDIGHRLGLEVVAECVADTRTVAALTALGVNYAQGFSLHRPELALFQR